ncbi:hypothetical protein NPIL_541611 [Nephila pilipes]|uniref:Uncharacterized protein n=1 Tax=Nephila pilipes TaxID=299642 RepID=A0A8X6TVQ1_NEPPI|nr:hypothetical protein NPIL_541611 [Nephila pilipes]
MEIQKRHVPGCIMLVIDRGSSLKSTTNEVDPSAPIAVRKTSSLSEENTFRKKNHLSHQRSNVEAEEAENERQAGPRRTNQEKRENPKRTSTVCTCQGRHEDRFGGS